MPMLTEETEQQHQLQRQVLRTSTILVNYEPVINYCYALLLVDLSSK